MLNGFQGIYLGPVGMYANGVSASVCNCLDVTCSWDFIGLELLIYRPN